MIMINKYINRNKELKEYMVYKVKHGTTKNGSLYTTFAIKDSIKLADGSFSAEFYNVFVWEALKINDRDKIAFNDIEALEVKTVTFNGKTQMQRTIFATVNVILQNEIAPTSNANPFKEPADAPFRSDMQEVDEGDLPF